MTPAKRPAPDDSQRNRDREDFWSALRMGLLVGGAALAIGLPALHYWKRPVPTTFPAQASQVQVQPQAVPPAPAAPAEAAQPPLRLASFGNEHPTDAVRQIANWSVYTGDHKQMALVVVDKKDARVWVFDPQGKLVANTPALLGAAIGDDSVPGIGEKPLSQVRQEEKTTPAGRFIAEPGVNASGEDVVWVSYDLAVSMHRVRPVVKAERRLERLASPTPADNRISFGCINLPPKFYEQVLSPTVRKYGAVIYVLPETRSPAEMFGAYDVTPDTHLALR
ncbi:hypothetical protein ACFPOE_15155 [Caenimonas terrae]|uniref:L,D-TPase catalytic domain-containing protein n=1 Tax=Caenimonas terrae TaxID=696074 RepID=A0ABW0NED6_9BURK